MVRAVLIVLKAWHNAGCPKFTPDRTASVEAWSDTIRQIVIWIGRNGLLDVADPVASIDAGFEADPDTRKLDALLRAWEAEFGAARQPVKALRPYAENGETELFEALDEIGAIERGAFNPRRLGRWIEQRAGRVVGGRRFVQDGSRSNALLWRVETLHTNESRSENGEFGGFGEFSPTYARDEKSDENCNENGLNQTHQTHQTHRKPPWRRSAEDAREAENET